MTIANNGSQTRAAPPEWIIGRLRPENAPSGFETASKSILSRIQSALMAAAADPLELPFDEAIAFFRQKVAIATKSWRDIFDAAHSKMFMVAGAQTEALVKDFQGAIERALKDGTTLEDFRKDFDQIVKTHGWSYNGDRGWRTRVIFETNLRTAYAAGRFAQLNSPEIRAAYPGWRYNHSGSKHPRHDHLAWDGKVWAADDPIWQSIYPPNGFGCGCFVTPVRYEAVETTGYDATPNLDQIGTDQPRGVDQSFDYNPGAAWLARTAPGPKAVTADETQVAKFVRTVQRGKWPDGTWQPVAKAGRADAEKLGVKAGTEVRLSADTIRSHAHHDRITSDAYAVLPNWLKKNGRLAQDKNGRWAFVGEHEGANYHAALKVVKKGDREEIYLTSLRRTTARKMKKLK
ncbi:phage minor head protein [uncultured Martelella sp.]|uniref:phage head morphogenesis protein n=1 Tax=uncultured Martelella sp. TaxID=392331 RepID=UPI0029C98E9A|nr:phage minor head protein [uncultured Martelella sp.]